MRVGTGESSKVSRGMHSSSQQPVPALCKWALLKGNLLCTGMAPCRPPQPAVLHGGTNILRHENVEGSPLLLLALLSICNTAVWLALFSLFVRLPVRFNCVTLPILALVPVSPLASCRPSACSGWRQPGLQTAPCNSCSEA